MTVELLSSCDYIKTGTSVVHWNYRVHCITHNWQNLPVVHCVGIKKQSRRLLAVQRLTTGVADAYSAFTLLRRNRKPCLQRNL